jgi:hypothetical protein
VETVTPESGQFSNWAGLKRTMNVTMSRSEQSIPAALLCKAEVTDDPVSKVVRSSAQCS